MSKLLFIFFCFSLLLAGNGNAAVGWDEILRVARENNPRLKTAANSLESAQYALKGSYSSFMPRISASANRSLDTDRTSAGLSGSLTLFSGGENIFSLERSRIFLEREKESYRRTFSNTVYNLKMAYAGVLRSLQELDLAEDILGRRRDNYQIVEIRYEAGREDRGAYLRAGADYARARQDLSSARRGYELSLLNLLKEMGLDNSRDIEVKGDLSIERVPSEPDIETLALQTPEYKISSLAVESARFDRGISRSNFLPSLSVSASRSYSAYDGFNFNDGGWTAGLSLSVPLFSGFRNTYNYKSSGLALETARESRRQAKMDSIYDITSALSSLEDAGERISVQEKYFEATRERADIAREKYLNGLISYQDWNTIENDYISALDTMLGARHNLFTAKAAWKRTIGEY